MRSPADPNATSPESTIRKNLRPVPSGPNSAPTHSPPHTTTRSRNTHPKVSTSVLRDAHAGSHELVSVPPASSPHHTNGDDRRPGPTTNHRQRSETAGQLLLRKEVIQPHLPVRLPCYDLVPIANPTFDSSLPHGLGHWLRVLPTFVT
jgi:hypothetical protein